MVPRRGVALRLACHTGSEADPVKLIIAIIQPNKLESVKEALSEVEVFRLTVLDVQGFGRQRGHAETYRGHEIAVNLLRKVQLQIAVNDEFVEPTIAAIVKGGRTGERGEIGDGRVRPNPHRRTRRRSDLTSRFTASWNRIRPWQCLRSAGMRKTDMQPVRSALAAAISSATAASHRKAAIKAE